VKSETTSRDIKLWDSGTFRLLRDLYRSKLLWIWLVGVGILSDIVSCKNVPSGQRAVPTEETISLYGMFFLCILGRP